MTIRFPIQRFTVSGDSMLPTLKEGTDVLVLCWFLNLKVGDIAAIKKHGKEIIKRIQKVRGREYFVQGDNKERSIDSRSFGWINKKDIVGKVIWHMR